MGEKECSGYSYYRSGYSKLKTLYFFIVRSAIVYLF